jgi:hypothetical protein
MFDGPFAINGDGGGRFRLVMFAEAESELDTRTFNGM